MPKCAIKGCKKSGKYTIGSPGYQGHRELQVCLDHYLDIKQGAELEVEGDDTDTKQSDKPEPRDEKSRAAKAD